MRRLTRNPWSVAKFLRLQKCLGIQNYTLNGEQHCCVYSTSRAPGGSPLRRGDTGFEEATEQSACAPGTTGGPFLEAENFKH